MKNDWLRLLLFMFEFGFFFSLFTIVILVLANVTVISGISYCMLKASVCTIEAGCLYTVMFLASVSRDKFPELQGGGGRDGGQLEGQFAVPEIPARGAGGKGGGGGAASAGGGRAGPSTSLLNNT